ncbi:DUF7269 family protein [Halorubellus salinus]|uniref:DUF7269 family protein n=1 Tax=Halorubellus salinus TaxID=755309 RepID=UPI001D097FC8|nr:hypothetical protein [Halorubellus salinus]
MSRRRPSVRELVGAVGTVAFAVGLVAAFAPDLLPAPVTAAVSEVESAVEPWVVVLVLSLLVFAYAVYRFWRADDGTVERLVRDDDAAAPDLDAVSVDFDPERPGRAFDYAVARTVAQLEADPNADAWEADRVREDLEIAAVAVQAARGMDPDAARAAVESGAWTDDRVAAAFLGGPEAPGVSLWRRVYAWLYPARAFRRRVECVVAVVEEQAAGSVVETTADGSAAGTTEDDSERGESTAGRDGDGARGRDGDGARGRDGDGARERDGGRSPDGSEVAS